MSAEGAKNASWPWLSPLRGWDSLTIAFTCKFIYINLPDNIILRTVDVVGLCPNIPHEEDLSAIKKRLDNRMEKYISSGTLCDLAEVILKSNIFKFGKKTLKQKRGTAIGTKFAPPYSILFMAELEEDVLLCISV